MWQCQLECGAPSFIKLAPSSSPEVANLTTLPMMHKGLCIVPVLHLVSVPALDAVAVVMPAVRTLSTLLAAPDSDPAQWAPALIPKLCKVTASVPPSPFHWQYMCPSPSLPRNCPWLCRWWNVGARLGWSTAT